MLQSECRGQGAKLGVISGCGIVNNLNHPVVLGVTDGGVSITRDFPVCLGHGSGDLVRVQVAAGLSVDETENLTITNVFDRVVEIKLLLEAVRVEEPVVVRILVVVAGDLLLTGSFGICLDVRVKETTSVTHVLEGDTGTESDFERTVLADFCAFEVGLEQRAHLGISWAAVFKDKEMKVEGKEIDNHGNDDEAKDTETYVCGELKLGHLQVSKLVPQVFNCIESNKSGTEHADPFDTADTANGQTGHHQPESPLGREGLVLQAVEFGPAEDSGESEEEQHRVEQDEPADGGVRVLEKDHHGNQPDSELLEAQGFGSVIGDGNAKRAESRVEEAHEGVVELWRVCLAGLELKGTVVACQVAGQTNQHLAERRVNIEIELTLQIVRSELSETVEDAVSIAQLDIDL